MCVVIFMVDCSTYIIINTISHNWKNSTTIRSLKVTPHTLLTSHYSRTIPSSLSYFTFSHQTLYTFPFPPTSDTSAQRLISLNYIPLRTSGDQYKSCSFSLCTFLQCPATAVFICPHLCLTALCFGTSCVYM